jgi:hypothetical protein
MLAGDRSPDDTATWTAVIARVERASCTPAPRAVLSARTGADLHAALLEWQDATEIRDGRRAREPRKEMKRTPDPVSLGVRLAARAARSATPARHPR